MYKKSVLYQRRRYWCSGHKSPPGRLRRCRTPSPRWRCLGGPSGRRRESCGCPRRCWRAFSSPCRTWAQGSAHCSCESTRWKPLPFIGAALSTERTPTSMKCWPQNSVHKSCLVCRRTSPRSLSWCIVKLDVGGKFANSFACFACEYGIIHCIGIIGLKKVSLLALNRKLHLASSKTSICKNY